MRNVSKFYGNLFMAFIWLVYSLFLGILALFRLCFPADRSVVSYLTEGLRGMNNIPSEVPEHTKSEVEVIEVFDEIEDEEEDVFAMQQLIPLNKDTSIIVDHVELCPEETAFIRIISDDAFSAIYKRRVYRNKLGDRYFKYNNKCIYLDDEKTKPIVKQEKRK